MPLSISVFSSRAATVLATALLTITLQAGQCRAAPQLSALDLVSASRLPAAAAMNAEVAPNDDSDNEADAVVRTLLKRNADNVLSYLKKLDDYYALVARPRQRREDLGVALRKLSQIRHHYSDLGRPRFGKRAPPAKMHAFNGMSAPDYFDV